jgi:hypothetical protein
VKKEKGKMNGNITGEKDNMKEEIYNTKEEKDKK